jgi:hypothetical protein
MHHIPLIIHLTINKAKPAVIAAVTGSPVEAYGVVAVFTVVTIFTIAVIAHYRSHL